MDPPPCQCIHNIPIIPSVYVLLLDYHTPDDWHEIVTHLKRYIQQQQCGDTHIAGLIISMLRIPIVLTRAEVVAACRQS